MDEDKKKNLSILDLLFGCFKGSSEILEEESSSFPSKKKNDKHYFTFGLIGDKNSGKSIYFYIIIKS